MKKHTAVWVLLAVSAFFTTASCFAATKSAAAIKKEALQKDTVQSAILYIKSMTDSTASQADKRSLLYFLGKLEESMGLYSDASRSYASACAIAAGDAEGMPKVSSEQLVLCAVRTSLCAGEFDNADSYLNSAVRSSKDAAVLAYVNLYAAWSQLCRAQDASQTADTLALLRAYVGMDSMKAVRPCVLFTLWYLTDDVSYSDLLKKEYPSSPEYAIVCGKANVVSVPFWYFVPRAEHNLADESTSANKNVSVADRLDSLQVRQMLIPLLNGLRQKVLKATVTPKRVPRELPTTLLLLMKMQTELWDLNLKMPALNRI